MPRLQFTPWKDLSELLVVRSQFYPLSWAGDNDGRAQACSQVWVWKLRGNLPHEVEATALLTDAILHDRPTELSIFSIRATYSAAFCRFVTGLVDSKLYGPRQTMYQKAMTLGLPASFVELRHEATHRELPSLVVLRNAVQRSLDWLWDVYWAKLPENPPVEIDDVLGSAVEDAECLRDMIRTSLQPVILRSRELENPMSEKKTGLRNMSSQIAKGFPSVCSHRHQSILVDELLNEGVMLPPNRSFGSPMDVTFSAWDDFLIELCRLNVSLMTVLVDNITATLVAADIGRQLSEPYPEALFLWIDHILNSERWSILRNRHLDFSYVKPLCKQHTGHWMGRVCSSLGERLEDTSNSEKAYDVELTSSRAASEPMETSGSSEAGSDMAILSSYGWNVSDSWKPKPIGIS